MRTNEAEPIEHRRATASRLARRCAAAAALCLPIAPVWPVPVQLSEPMDQPFAALPSRSDLYGAKPAPATTPLLDRALTSIEPGASRWFDEFLANERGSFVFDPTSDQGFGRPALSQRSIQLLSRVLLAQPPAASSADPGHETAPADWSGDLERPAGPTGWQWSGGGVGGGPFSPSAGAGAGADDAHAGAPAQADPVFAKLVPVLEYVRENRYQILGTIAAFLVVGGFLLKRLDRR